MEDSSMAEEEGVDLKKRLEEMNEKLRAMEKAREEQELNMARLIVELTEAKQQLASRSLPVEVEDECDSMPFSEVCSEAPAGSEFVSYDSQEGELYSVALNDLKTEHVYNEEVPTGGSEVVNYEELSRQDKEDVSIVNNEEEQVISEQQVVKSLPEVQEIIQNVESYYCVTCNKTFSQEKNYNDHLQIHRTSYSKFSMESMDLSAATTKTSTLQQTVSLLSATTEGKELYDLPVKETRGRKPVPYKCTQCCQTFRQKRWYDLHLKRKHHKIPKIEKDSPQPVDSFDVNYKPRLDKVLKLVLTRIDEQRLSDYKTSSLNANQENVGTLYRCVICKLSFKQKKECAQHLKKNHKSDVQRLKKSLRKLSNPVSYSQSDNNFSNEGDIPEFAESASIDQTLGDVSNPQNNSFPKKTSQNNILYNCSICKLSFKQKVYYEQHMKGKYHQIEDVNRRNSYSSNSVSTIPPNLNNQANLNEILTAKSNIVSRKELLTSLKRGSIKGESANKNSFKKIGDRSKVALKSEEVLVHACQTCNTSYVNEVEYKNHLLSHSLSPFKDKATVEDAQSEEYMDKSGLLICLACNESYSSNECYYQHQCTRDLQFKKVEGVVSLPSGNVSRLHDKSSSENRLIDKTSVSKSNDVKNMKYSCVFCGESFRNPSKLFEHKISHVKMETEDNGSSFSNDNEIEKILAGFEDVSSLPSKDLSNSVECSNQFFEECQSEHKGTITLICTFCSTTFSSYENFCEHRDTHLTQTQVDDTSYIDVKSSGDFSKECHLSNRKISSELLENKKTDYSCIFCGETFTNPSKLFKHKSAHVGLEFPSKNSSSKLNTHTKSRFVCEICGHTYSTLYHLEVHMTGHTGTKPYLCAVCGRSFIRQRQLEQHNILRHSDSKPFLCFQCGRSFTDPDYLRKHELQHEGISPYQCRQCEEGFKHKNALTAHYKVAHGKVNRTSTANPQKKGFINTAKKKCSNTSRQRVSCTVCHKTFSSKLLLHSHMNWHIGVKPHVCPVCQKSFFSKHHLYYHAKIHEENRNFICQICQRKFKSKESLKHHGKTHSEEKPFVCKFCGRQFRRVSDGKIHELLHTEDKPFNCETCGRGFNQKKHLVQHDRVIHQGRRDHICEICNKAFTSSSYLHEHRKRHESPETVTCDVCNGTFSHRFKLASHMKKHTKGTKVRIDLSLSSCKSA